MVPWSPPGHWSKDRRAAHDRSIEFVRSIVSMSPYMFIDQPKALIPTVFVQGNSRRWYRIDTTIHDQEEWLNGYGLVDETVFSIHVLGGTRKKDVIDENSYAVSICIGPRNEARDLPIGDQLGALALSLRSDKATSLRIPLLSQFIVQPREALKDVIQFSEEGVILLEDVWMPHQDMEDPFEEYYNRPCEEATPSLFEIREDIRVQQDLANDMAFDEWFADHDHHHAVKEEDVPWHHDDDQIWGIEETLRKRRNRS